MTTENRHAVLRTDDPARDPRPARAPRADALEPLPRDVLEAACALHLGGALRTDDSTSTREVQHALVSRALGLSLDGKSDTYCDTATRYAIDALDSELARRIIARQHGEIASLQAAGSSPAQLRARVVGIALPGISLTGKSETYVSEAFRRAVETLDGASEDSAHAELRADGGEDASSRARREYSEALGQRAVTGEQAEREYHEALQGHSR